MGRLTSPVIACLIVLIGGSLELGYLLWRYPPTGTIDVTSSFPDPIAALKATPSVNPCSPAEIDRRRAP